MDTSPRKVIYTNFRQEPFCLYIFDSKQKSSGRDGAVLVCVHGAGMSGHSFFRLANYLQSPPGLWSDVCSTTLKPLQSSLFHHGETVSTTTTLPRVPPLIPLAPPSSINLSQQFSANATHQETCIRSSKSEGELCDLSLVTYDLRCHGDSTYQGGEANLTIQALMDDFIAIFGYVQSALFPEHSIYVLGHSLGGAIVAKALASPSNKPLAKLVSGVILVDVVEDTARQSLRYMPEFLKRRPTQFASIAEAEKWFLQHGGMKSPEGAAVSVPPLLCRENDRFVWRTNLSEMQEVWQDWFTGLDNAFVSLPMLKMLCLAYTERLDRELMIAQMQGKFQLEIMGSGCGHYIMDDATSELGIKIRRFVNRIESLSEEFHLRITPRVSLPVDTLRPVSEKINHRKSATPRQEEG